jgi:MYXO-CTERM domain-containing protein
MKRGKMNLMGPIPKAGNLSKFLKLAACGTLGLSAAQSKAESTITFEGFTAANNNIANIDGYGDYITGDSVDWNVAQGRTHVVGTPNIALDWALTGWDTYTEWDGRGTVAQTDFNASQELSLLFTPSVNSAVRIVSFQLDEWNGGGDGLIHWSISGAQSGVLATGDWNMTTAGGRSLLNPDVTGRNGEALTLNFELGTGSPSYFAMDNLTFDQVPEPSTVAIGALGAVALGAAAMRRRRA